MKYSKIVVPVWALSKKGALAKARGAASKHFRESITKIQKSGLCLANAEIAPVVVERNWFKYWVHYEINVNFGKTKKEPNCKVKKVKPTKKKVTKKAKKKVYKK